MVLNIWIARNSNGPELLGWITTVGSFAMFIGNPFGGMIADVYNKKKLLIIADFMCGLGTLITFLSYTENQINIIPLIFSQIILSLAFALYSPTSRSIAPFLVEGHKLRTLNSYLSISSETIKIIVPAISSILLSLSFISEKKLILINTIGFFTSSIVNSFLSTSEKKILEKFHISKIWTSYVEVWKDLGPIKTILIPICLINFFSGGTAILFPFLGKAVSITHYPNLLLAQALGAVAGGFISGKLNDNLPWSKSKWLLIVCGITLLGLHPQFSFYLHYFFIFIYGLSLSIFNINFFTLVQSITPDRIIGRTFGLIFTIGSGLVPFGNLIFGYIGSITPNYSIQIAGIGMLLVILFIVIFGKKLFNTLSKSEI